MTMTTKVWNTTFYGSVDLTTTYYGSRGGSNWFVIRTFICGNVTKFHKQAAMNVQGGSLPGIVIVDQTALELYIGLNPQPGMKIVSEVICTVEC